MSDLIMTAGPGLLALAWLALREIAPRTETKLDDRLVEAIRRTVADQQAPGRAAALPPTPSSTAAPPAAPTPSSLDDIR